jgi:hypothetical protein
MIINKKIDIPLDGIIFADTGGELPHTYENIQKIKKLSEDNGIEFVIVKRSDFIEDKYKSLEDCFFERYHKKNGEKSDWAYSQTPIFLNRNGGTVVLRHQCASNFKIFPQVKYLRKKYGKDTIIVNYIGISTDEIQRVKPAREKNFENEFPLIKHRLSRNHCLHYLDNLGWNVRKSRCYFCGFQSPSNWKEVKQQYPEYFNKAIKIDEHVRDLEIYDCKAYLLRSMIPLSVSNFEEDQMDLFDNDCGGNCAL